MKTRDKVRFHQLNDFAYAIEHLPLTPETIDVHRTITEHMLKLLKKEGAPTYEQQRAKFLRANKTPNLVRLLNSIR